ncbi:MAG: hypothetical protein JWM76_2742 [Pseudonocardiales bacterium]|nr:hypothetical protein [Pseudonocardiales bacterium]
MLLEASRSVVPAAIRARGTPGSPTPGVESVPPTGRPSAGVQRHNGEVPDPEAPALTEDGHHVVIAGRRWRATDPAIPETLRKELVGELMSARRDVRADPASARPRVNDAKVALGERGDPWWDPTPAGRRTRLAATMRALLRHRSADATICPSDAARVVGGASWRALMDEARSVAAELAQQGILVVRQHGTDVDLADAVGPVRLARGRNW